MKESLSTFYNKNYKRILLLPALLLLLSLIVIGHTYFTTGDFIHRDISLTGGTTITIFTDKSPEGLHSVLGDAEIRVLSDNSGKQTQIIVVTSESPEAVTPKLESFFGFKLNGENSSIEFTGSTLGEGFYRQLLIAIAIAFFWMAAVVFIIFSNNWKIKLWAIVLNLLFGIFLGKIFLAINPYVGVPILLAFAASLIFIYIKNSTPSFAVMLCAFADIIMTLAIVDLFGMKISGAGIVAFLMLIGYSVDTDILLTTRVLKRKNTSVNHEIFSSFKTGMTMTLTAIAAVGVALFFVYPFQTSLNQIFTILLIGLALDIFNTWVTNTSLIKWYAERQHG
jgi:preprotein translocase subunit SecF